MKNVLTGIVWGAAFYALISLGSWAAGCNDTKTVTKTVRHVDTLVQVVTRPVTVTQTKWKTIQLVQHDTLRTVEYVPCIDSAFVVQADEIHTQTKDTINISYRHPEAKFSVVFRPRPDTLQTVNIVDTLHVRDNSPNLLHVALSVLIGVGIGAIARGQK